MATSKVLVICPRGHSFVTVKILAQEYTCPDCGETFAQEFGQVFDLLD